MKTKLLTLLLAVVTSAGTMYADKVQIGDLYFNLDATNQTAEVTSGGSYSGSIIIPESVTYNTKTYSVTSIGYRAFYLKSGLTSVTIPNSVTSIGEKAFSDCTGLTSIEIPNSVTSIGYGAFYYCSGLTSVTMSNSVTRIGEVAFNTCSNLTSITIPSSVTSIGSRAFDYCSNLNSIYITDMTAWCNLYLPKSDEWYAWAKYDLFLNGTLVEDLVIPDNVQSIKNCVFENCRSLRTIVIPNSVKNIGEKAFFDCPNLASVVLGDSIEEIGEKAFAGLANLTTINFPPSLKRIGNSAFYQCSHLSLENVIFPDGIENIGVSAFRECTSLTGALVIPEGITSISSYAFQKCAFSDIILPSTLKEIGSSAFYNNRGVIQHLVIPDSVTKIGSNAFYLDGIAKLTIGKNVTTIENGAFYYSGWCRLDTIIWNAVNGPNPFYYYTSGGGNANTIRTHIKHITIGEEVQTVPTALFEDLPELNSIEWNAKHAESSSSYRLASGTTTNVKKVTFTPTCEYIPANFCTQMTNLQDMYLPNTITELGNNAFAGCSGLKNIHYDGTLTEWCDGMYSSLMQSWNGGNLLIGTDTLKDLIIPNNNNNIATYGFAKCQSLRSIIIPNHVLSVGNNAFAFCTNVDSIAIGDGITTIESGTFNTCSSLNALTLGKNIKKINDQAFYNCENLTNIYNYRQQPANVYSTAFDGVDKFACTLYVPNSSIDMYKAAAVWRDFYYIKPLNMIPSAIIPISNNSEVPAQATKLLHDGQLLILRDGKVYDVTGRKL